MTRQERFADLRRVLVAGLMKIEDDGGSLGDAAVELIKAGVTLSIAANGAEMTIAGIRAQADQLDQAMSEKVGHA